MKGSYRPNLGGFSSKLGLKNGIDDLLRIPVPEQEVLYFRQNDINGVKTYSGKRHQRHR